MTAQNSTADPRHTYLSAQQVIARFGWGRTKGYDMLKHDLTGFPRSIGGRYRLDTVLAWEDAVLAGDIDPKLPSKAAAQLAAPLSIPESRRRVRKAA